MPGVIPCRLTLAQMAFTTVMVAIAVVDSVGTVVMALLHTLEMLVEALGRLVHTMTPAPSMPDSEYSAYGNNPNKQGRMFPYNTNKRARGAHDSSPGYEMQGYPHPYQGGRTKIKRESPAEERCDLAKDFDNPDNDLGVQDDDEDKKAAVDADIEAMELELKLAKMKAARLRKKK
jgi:hypothetical protein